jgi:hypothetical protein
VVTGWRCALLAFAALACRDEAAIPTPLQGQWVSTDARYSGRSLLVAPHSLIFAASPTASENFAVRGVDSRTESDGSLVATIEYGKGDEHLTLRLRRFETDPPSLVIGDRPERWTLAPLTEGLP